MKVKIHLRRDTVTPNLPALTRLGILEGEALNWAQSELKQIGTLALIGRHHG